ncbi:hypothetical protein LJC34_01990 [Oscillospiraceae bacterium OttesenSCG-928-G22]|nr:hypothetical protein [Oscillospiraceae bacterium OttesenSCG-928-G22]
MVHVTAMHNDNYLVTKQLRAYSDEKLSGLADRLAIVYLLARHGVAIWDVKCLKTALKNLQKLDDDSDYEEVATYAIAIRKTLEKLNILSRDETDEIVYVFLKYLSNVILDVDELMPDVYPLSDIRAVTSIDFVIDNEIFSFPVPQKEGGTNNVWSAFEIAVSKQIAEHYQKWKYLRDNQVPTRPIEDLDLSVRTFNCLKRAGINTVGDLSMYSAEALSNIRNLGRKGHEQLIEICQENSILLDGKEASNDWWDSFD